jgi:hypothetical protein
VLVEKAGERVELVVGERRGVRRMLGRHRSTVPSVGQERKLT